MTPLLIELLRHGVRLRIVDGRLAYDAPCGQLSTSLVQRIKAKRNDLMRLLAAGTARDSYATRDSGPETDLPIYDPADEPLPVAQTPREAGIDALILAYACRRRIRHWLDLAGHRPLDEDVLADVRTDLETGLAMLAPGKSATVGEPDKANGGSALWKNDR